jgi:hypothetical protein
LSGFLGCDPAGLGGFPLLNLLLRQRGCLRCLNSGPLPYKGSHPAGAGGICASDRGGLGPVIVLALVELPGGATDLPVVDHGDTLSCLPNAIQLRAIV